MIPERETLFWILGRGGLLGSALPKAIAALVPGGRCWTGPIRQLSWGDHAALRQQLGETACTFSRDVREARAHWAVLWVAGAGVIGTSEQELAAETSALQMLLMLLDEHLLTPSSDTTGLVFLASSAGGIYGNCADAFITEASTPQPISPYGRNKQRQEALFNTWADKRPRVRCRIGRLSNLYGPGQNLAKRQGLISHVSRSLIWGYPIHIYVPLDTIRDYLFVDDCAAQIAACITEWGRPGTPTEIAPFPRVKIFATEQPTTVAQIVRAFLDLPARRHPKIICAPSALGLQQPRRLQFRSIEPPLHADRRRTPLHVGVHKLHEYQLALYRQGCLASPFAFS
jgi:UDP-glucose 4-epimerase